MPRTEKRGPPGEPRRVVPLTPPVTLAEGEARSGYPFDTAASVSSVSVTMKPSRRHISSGGVRR